MANSALVLRILGIDQLNLLKKNGSAIDKIRATFAKKVEFKSDIKTIEFEGDGQKVRKYLLEAVDADIECDQFDLAALTESFGITIVTTGITGSSERGYFGSNLDSGGIKLGLEAICQAEDVATGTNITVAITLPVGTLSTAAAPSLETRNKSPMKLQFSAEKTTKDIAGAALPSVPADGCFWYYDKLAA